MSETLGTLTQSVLAPVAGLLWPVAGAAAWGWAVLVIGALWRLPLWAWLLRSARVRIVRQMVAPVAAAGRDMRDAATRKEVAALVRAELVARGLRSPASVAFGRVVAVLGVLTVLLLAVWSRTGSAATRHGFAGMDNLSGSAVSTGVGGIAVALVLVVAAVAAQVAVLRAAGVTDPRQRFFATRISPVIFAGLGLFLPAGVVLAFAAVMLLNLAATLRVAADPPPRPEAVAPQAEEVAP